MSIGLRYFLNYNRICGITFLGFTDIKKSKSKWKVMIYLIWCISLSMLIVASLFVYPYHQEVLIQKAINKTADINDNPEIKTSNFIEDLVRIMCLSCTNVYILNEFIHFIYFNIFGKKLIEILTDQQCFHDMIEKDLSISKHILTFQIIPSIMTLSICIISEILRYDRSLIYLLALIIIAIATNEKVTGHSIIALMAFKVKRQFKIFIESNTPLNQVHTRVCHIERTINELDKYISFDVMISIVFNIYLCVSAICHLIYFPGFIFYEILYLFIFSFSHLGVLCHICQVIPNSLSNLIDKYNQSILVANQGNNILENLENQRIVMNLREVNSRIGFTCFRIFRVTKYTFILCIAKIVGISIFIWEANK